MHINQNIVYKIITVYIPKSEVETLILLLILKVWNIQTAINLCRSTY